MSSDTSRKAKRRVKQQEYWKMQFENHDWTTNQWHSDVVTKVLAEMTAFYRTWMQEGTTKLLSRFKWSATRGFQRGTTVLNCYNWSSAWFAFDFAPNDPSWLKCAQLRADRIPYLRDDSKRLQLLRQQYKVHLALKTEKIPEAFNMLLVALKADSRFACSLLGLKLHVENSSNSPSVVLYCRFSSNAIYAQYVLATISRLFACKQEWWNGTVLDMNIHVDGPIFYAGGNSDQKRYVRDYVHDCNGNKVLDKIWSSKTNHALFHKQPALLAM